MIRSSFVKRAPAVKGAFSPAIRWLSRTACATAVIFLTSAVAAAQDYSGQYVLLVEGHAVLSVSLRQNPAGQVSGTVIAGGETLPLSGSVQGGRAYMSSTAPDGSVMHWEAQAQGQSLVMAMAPAGADGRPDPSLIQRHVLMRGGGQPGGGIGAVSQQWVARIAAVADAVASWCSSPLYASSDICVNAMQLLRKVAPALMVARFATGGEASTLLRVIMAGPGSGGGGAGLPQAPPGMDAGFLAPPPSGQSMYDGQPYSSPVAAQASPEPAAQAWPEPGPEAWPEPDPQAWPEPAPAQHPAAATPVQAPGLAQTLLSGAHQAGGQTSQTSGDYVMLHGGTEILRIQFSDAGGGAVSGTLTLVGTHFPFTGTLSSGRLDFTTTSASGQRAHWQGHMVGDELIATLAAGGSTERYVLNRRGAGWSEDDPDAVAWRQYLENRTISHTAGGGVAETLLHLCSGGILRVETSSSFDLSMSQAGGAGSQPHRSVDSGRWRTLGNGDLVALELVSSEGTVQVGLRRTSGDQISIAEQPAFARAGASCN